MHRLFVAIRPPESIRDLLIDAMDDSPDFRWQDEEQLHLTLRFIGEVDRHVASDVAEGLARIRSRSFDARITGLGRFEQRSAGALWAGVEPKEPLAALPPPGAGHDDAARKDSSPRRRVRRQAVRDSQG